MVSTLPQIEQRVKLSGIDWKTYQVIRSDPDNRNIRLSYYRGVLEVMAPSPEYEYTKKVLGRYSLAFPKIEAKGMESFLQQAMEKDYLTLVREFRHWLNSGRIDTE